MLNKTKPITKEPSLVFHLFSVQSIVASSSKPVPVPPDVLHPGVLQPGLLPLLRHVGEEQLVTVIIPCTQGVLLQSQLLSTLWNQTAVKSQRILNLLELKF